MTELQICHTINIDVDNKLGFDTTSLFNLPLAGESVLPLSLAPDLSTVPTKVSSLAPDQLQAKYQTALGQVWRLGPHLLACGDSTTDDTVDSLLLVSGTGRTFKPGAGIFAGVYSHLPDNRDTSPYLLFFAKVQSLASEMLCHDGSFFFTIRPRSLHGTRDVYIEEMVVGMVRKWSWARIDTFTWIHRSITGEFINRFKDGHQEIYHFAKSPYLKFNPSNVEVPYKQASSAEPYHKAKSRKARGSRKSKPFIKTYGNRALPDNVLERYGSPGDFPPHDLAGFFMRAYSDDNDLWLDPFCGNGHALIAAQRYSRILYGIDSDPMKIATALESWSLLTGKIPEMVKQGV